ncbi:MAG: mechanosensitive ion channel family protein [bacterium]
MASPAMVGGMVGGMMDGRSPLPAHFVIFPTLTKPTMTTQLDAIRKWADAFFAQWPMAEQGLTTLAVVLAALLAHRLVRILIDRAVTDHAHRQGYRSLARYLWILVGSVLVAGVWLEELMTVGLVLTGLMAGLFIGLKEVFLGLVGRVVLAAVHPYRIGDRICINKVCGDVINLGLLYTWVFDSGGEDGSHQSSGRVLTFPHAWLFQYPITNASQMRGYVWDEMALDIPGDAPLAGIMSSIEAAAEKLGEADLPPARRATARIKRNFAVLLPPLEPKVYATLPPDGVTGSPPRVRLTVRYIVPTRAIRDRRHQLTLAILLILREAGIFPPENAAENVTDPPAGAVPMAEAEAEARSDAKQDGE